jgi:hypothetical protein
MMNFDMKKIIQVLVVFTTIIAGCNKTNENIQDDNLIVVEAYLYANDSVNKIHLSKTIPFSSSDTVFENVTDANVYILSNGTKYPLEHSGEGIYKCLDTNLKIIEGNLYKLQIEYNGSITTAETYVPSKPENISLSKSLIYVNSYFRPVRPDEGVEDTNRIEITWDNPNNDYFYVLIENLEDNPEDITSGFSIPNDGGRRMNFRFLSMPFMTNRYSITPFMSVQQYGRHRARIFKVNLEYANLYENRVQDSRNLTEPISNINNGLGIFTAFSYEDVYFTVLKTE